MSRPAVLSEAFLKGRLQIGGDADIILGYFPDLEEKLSCGAVINKSPDFSGKIT